MTEHSLDSLHVGPRTDRKRSRRMPQLVRGQPVQPDCGCRRVEDVAPEVQVPKDRSAPGDEDECVGGFASHGDREVVDQKPGIGTDLA